VRKARTMSLPAPKRGALDYFIDVQDAVATRRQLASSGYDRDAVRAHVAARRWQTHGRNVVVLHNGPPTVRQQRWLAVLAQPTGALAGLTAAHEHGLNGFDDERVHVLIPFGARPHALPGVTVHVSRWFSEADVHAGRVLPVVGIERALVDAATWTPDRRKACGILAAGVQQRLTTAGRLRHALAVADRARHHRLLTQIVGDIEGGADSFAEIDFVLGDPAINRRFRDTKVFSGRLGRPPTRHNSIT